MRRSIAALCLMILATSASASVVFTWEAIRLPTLTSYLTAQIEVTDEAWESGHIVYDQNAGCKYYRSADVWFKCVPDPDSPIARISAGAGGAYMDLSPLSGRAGPFPDSGWLHFDFFIEGNALKSGYMSANNGESDFYFNGQDGLWTAKFDSDYGNCFMHCVDGLGTFTSAVYRVPEPTPAILMGVSAVGLILSRRKKAVIAGQAA